MRMAGWGEFCPNIVFWVKTMNHSWCIDPTEASFTFSITTNYIFFLELITVAATELNFSMFSTTFKASPPCQLLFVKLYLWGGFDLVMA